MDPLRFRTLTRRGLLGGAAATAGLLGGGLALRACAWRQPRQRVTVLRVPSYADDLAARLLEALRRWPVLCQRCRGASVLLKPNLVDHHPQRTINTDPRLVVAAVEAFRQLGAARVQVGDGPGHRRDSEALLEGSGLGHLLRALDTDFLDLNYDAVAQVPTPRDLGGLGSLPLAATVPRADLVISMPKLKTHHWAGLTLSMKNLFGTVSGSALGWPKNRLHWAGIERVTVDLWQAVRPAFAIVDGVVGMEGDGPLSGESVATGLVILGAHLPAVDATCARLVGMEAERLPTLRLARAEGGTIAASRIRLDGDKVAPQRFAPAPGWDWLINS